MEQDVYIDMNGKLHYLETKQIKRHMPSYVFLTSFVICVFINSDILYDTLGSIATFKLSKSRQKSRKPIF